MYFIIFQKMIKFSNKNIAFANIGKTAIQKIYKGGILLSELITGCFVKGKWINERPWTNNRGWKND